MNFVAAMARVLVAGLALFTVYRAVWVDDRDSWDKLTVLTAAVLAIVFMWGAWCLFAERRRAAGWIEGAAVLYAAVQGVIFTFLFDVQVESPPLLFGYTNGELLSFVVPAGALAVWLLFTPHRRIPWGMILLWPLPLLVYIGLFVYRGASDPGAGYPYPFMDLDALGWRGLAQNILLYVGAVVVGGAILIGIDRLLPTRTFLSGREN